MLEIQLCESEADEERSLAIYNAVCPWNAVTMAEVESFKKQMRDSADYLAIVDGQDAGSGVGARSRTRPKVGFALITVLPHLRRRGAGTGLYEAISRWLAARDVHELDIPVAEDDPESLAFAERRGFAEVERNSRLILDLGALDPPPVAPPSGIEIVTWAERPELAHGIYEVACEAYPDVPGDRDREMEPFEDWLAHDMQGSGDLPGATFAALAHGEVVGYAKFSLTAARPDVASHDMTGVKRAWRGRGVAGALKRTQIAWAKREGYARLETQNEVRNEPIRRLNERLGYRLAPGRLILRGPLAEPEQR